MSRPARPPPVRLRTVVGGLTTARCSLCDLPAKHDDLCARHLAQYGDKAWSEVGTSSKGETK